MLVKACLNGSRTRAEHEAVPLSPEELARDAAACAAAGAGAVHVHPRLRDGAQTLHGPTCAAVIEAIRGACPGLPVGLTTAAGIEPGDRVLVIERWHVLPDFVSVNFSEAGTEELCALLLYLGVGIEAGLATLDDVRTLEASGLAPRCLRALVEVEGGPDDAHAIDEALVAAGIGLPQLHHGYDAGTWPVLEAALERGHDVRVGLEDTLVLPDGTRARGNAELVRAAGSLGTARTAE